MDVYKHRASRASLTPWALVEPETMRSPDPNTRHQLFGDAKLALLYSGNMGQAHDYSLFLQLARIICKKDRGIVFTFACRGNRLEEFKNSVRPDDHNIRFAPFANESELEKRLTAADIHLISLHREWEGIVVPSKIFGSLAVGRPIIYAGPESSAIGKWIRQLDIGLILQEKNLDDVAKKILEIANQRNGLTIWQENAFRAYHKYFSKINIMDRWNRLLRDLLNNQ